MPAAPLLACGCRFHTARSARPPIPADAGIDDLPQNLRDPHVRRYRQKAKPQAKLFLSHVRPPAEKTNSISHVHNKFLLLILSHRARPRFLVGAGSSSGTSSTRDRSFSSMLSRMLSSFSRASFSFSSASLVKGASISAFAFSI